MTTPSPNPHSLQVRLYTKTAQHAIPDSDYFIPSNWKRFHLSQLINKVLGYEASSVVPFEFVIEGEILRGEIGEWVKTKGISEEIKINIEYIESILPPSHVSSFEHDDWVSSVSLQNPGYLLTGAYDSNIRIFSQTQKLLYSIPTSSRGGVTSVTWIPPASLTSSGLVLPESNSALVACGGMDGVTRIYSVSGLGDINDAGDLSGGKHQQLLSLHSNSITPSSISSISYNSQSASMLVANWDSTISIFDLSSWPTEHSATTPTVFTSSNSAARKQANKKRKVEGEDEEGWRVGPSTVLRGHKNRVGAAIWDRKESSRVWSCGWDGSVRGWDVDGLSPNIVKQGSADKICLDITQLSSGLLATSHADRTVSIWDAREGTSLVATTLRSSGSSFITKLVAHPTSAHHLVTFSQSSPHIRLWDVRSPLQPLFSIDRKPKPGKGEKVLAGDWDGTLIAAGGEDGNVDLWRGALGQEGGAVKV